MSKQKKKTPEERKSDRDFRALIGGIAGGFGGDYVGEGVLRALKGGKPLHWAPRLAAGMVGGTIGSGVGSAIGAKTASVMSALVKTAAKKDAPNYRKAESPAKSCGTCKFFKPKGEGTGLCTAYDFTCHQDMTCDTWAGKELKGGTPKNLRPKGRTAQERFVNSRSPGKEKKAGAGAAKAAIKGLALVGVGAAGALGIKPKQKKRRDPYARYRTKYAGVPFLEQKRPKKVKEIYAALDRDHPEYSAEKKARIASSKGVEKTAFLTQVIRNQPLNMRRGASLEEKRKKARAQREREREKRASESATWDAMSHGEKLDAGVGTFKGGVTGGGAGAVAGAALGHLTGGKKRYPALLGALLGSRVGGSLGAKGSVGKEKYKKIKKELKAFSKQKRAKRRLQRAESAYVAAYPMGTPESRKATVLKHQAIKDKVAFVIPTPSDILGL